MMYRKVNVLVGIIAHVVIVVVVDPVVIVVAAVV